MRILILNLLFQQAQRQNDCIISETHSFQSFLSTLAGGMHQGFVQKLFKNL